MCGWRSNLVTMYPEQKKQSLHLPVRTMYETFRDSYEMHDSDEVAVCDKCMQVQVYWPHYQISLI